MPRANLFHALPSTPIQVGTRRACLCQLHHFASFLQASRTYQKYRESIHFRPPRGKKGSRGIILWGIQTGVIDPVSTFRPFRALPLPFAIRHLILYSTLCLVRIGCLARLEPAEPHPSPSPSPSYESDRVELAKEGETLSLEGAKARNTRRTRERSDRASFLHPPSTSQKSPSETSTWSSDSCRPQLQTPVLVVHLCVNHPHHRLRAGHSLGTKD